MYEGLARCIKDQIDKTIYIICVHMKGGLKGGVNKCVNINIYNISATFH